MLDIREKFQYLAKMYRIYRACALTEGFFPQDSIKEMEAIIKELSTFISRRGVDLLKGRLIPIRGGICPHPFRCSFDCEECVYDQREEERDDVNKSV